MKKIIFSQYGRSMVEMLGVLAIIGVLSVGAISGYSKAMMKYKLNKQTEQISSILDYVNIYFNDFSRVKTSIVGNMIHLFTKLDAIPKEMIKVKYDNKIYDIFGNIITLVNYKSSTTNYYYFEFILQLNKETPKEVCINLLKIGKTKKEQLFRTKFQTTSEEKNAFYGDAYCKPSIKCLKDLTLYEIDESCDYCKDKDVCYFYYQMIF